MRKCKRERKNPVAYPPLCLDQTNLGLTSLDLSMHVCALWVGIIYNVQAHTRSALTPMRYVSETGEPAGDTSALGVMKRQAARQ